MRYMVSLSEFRNTLTHTLHHGCNIPIRDNRKLGVDDRSPGPAASRVLWWVLADPILTAVHDDCLTSDKGGIVAC